MCIRDRYVVEKPQIDGLALVAAQVHCQPLGVARQPRPLMHRRADVV